MSNAADAKARREEEIAFLIMEQVLGVDIHLADAGTGDKKPDGAWTYPKGGQRRGLVEVTSPPDQDIMKRWAQAKRDGQAQSETGSIPTHLNVLHAVCTELLAEGLGSGEHRKTAGGARARAAPLPVRAKPQSRVVLLPTL
ncbi:hypothetical protein [Ornithinimicrobium cryptoxanthini]|uniref:hypothetical protein n=1 Tax=Ornithinimicrobium cryptoxanthini TaxID=2934161 RepID=UPI002118C6BB|nr:hypothetical protein [Ornithinimicrobium cryptoxanthini]